MSEPWIALIASALAGAVLWWWLDGVILRRAARLIDRRFKQLQGAPSWTPLGDAGDIPRAAISRLDEFDALCRGSFGFAPLGRLREFSAEGALLGVRTVLLNPERTIAAVFACSHVRKELAFRSFVSETDGRIFSSTDAKSVSPETPEVTVLRHGAKEETAALLQDLRTQLAAVEAPLRRFESLGAYQEMQMRYWRIGDEARRRNGYVVDLESLRRLAPAHLSARRLARVHTEILKLNRS